MDDILEKLLNKMLFRLLFPELSWALRSVLWEKQTLKNDVRRLEKDCATLVGYIKQMENKL